LGESVRERPVYSKDLISNAGLVYRLARTTAPFASGKTVAGLIGSGDRKSDQPMAERLAPGDYTELQFCQCWHLGYGAECARFTIVLVVARCWPTV
jgi:hypothetical protein